jgi:hypothetical protein
MYLSSVLMSEADYVQLVRQVIVGEKAMIMSVLGRQFGGFYADYSGNGI